MEKINKQHVELPSTKDFNDLTSQDKLVYIGIRSFMNKDSMEAFPSQRLVGETLGCCDKTVRKCVKNLVDNNYIKTRKEGKKIIYIFNKLKQFEPFSYEFIKDKSLSFTEKAFLAASQEYMYDKESGLGKISYSKMELANKINMPYPSLVRVTRSLSNQNIIDTIQLNNHDQLTGCKKQQMQFDFQKYHQGIVAAFLNHESRIQKAEEKVIEIEALKKALTPEQRKVFETEKEKLKKEKESLSNK